MNSELITRAFNICTTLIELREPLCMKEKKIINRIEIKEIHMIIEGKKKNKTMDMEVTRKDILM